MKRGLLLCLLLPAVLRSAVDFNREIRPILSDNCFACHGPDEKQRMAGLRLDTRDGAFAKAIVPGKAAESPLFQRINAGNKARRMPPPHSGQTLTERQIELVRRWIDEGAKWETHWAYTPPRRPELPAVKQSAWARNPIDRFILARLEREGLRPSPEADRTTLLRRVTFDLTGLPPTPAEVAAFLADRSPAAYDKVVDRLLASPRYGERMAMQWLDLARYADTHGYHIDSHRDMWHWRDWVIGAFNRNLPFDRFTVEQLAGDLLPGATTEQKIATGFNRNHMINFEGGAIPEEYQNEYVVDRVEATSNAWMAMTMGCARCHDHKYDPIRQRDFYQFYAFFNNIPEKGLDGRRGNAEPVLALPAEEQSSLLKQLEGEIRAREGMLPEKEIAALQEAWEKTRLDSMPQASREGLLLHYEMDGNLADSSGAYRHARVLAGDPAFSAGMAGKAADFDGQTEVRWTGFDLSKPFSLALWIRTSGTKAMALPYGMWTDDFVPLPKLQRGVHLYFRDMRTRERLVVGDWYHVAFVFDGSRLSLYLNGKPAAMEPGKVEPAAARYRGRLDDLRIYTRPLAAPEIEQLAVEEPARATLFLHAKARATEQSERLRDYFLVHDAPPAMRTAYGELKQLRVRKEQLEDEIPTAMVMAEMEKPRDTFVLGRGDYRNRTEKVAPATPSFLPPMPQDLPRNRLGLARWLVSPAHPLTARVAVNRYWQMYFGTGIVKTAEDFGSQGEAPVHPELLDWLATEFIRTGWDIKAMQRLIVTSAAYRQSSRVTPALREKDPENRLLARGPRFRLPAEMVRDNALAVSGLLNEKRGGPSVFPYQPEGLWEEIAYGDVYSAQTYKQSHGSDLYRRSMYTFWKRTSPPPALATFDAPDREKCVARRALTNTPLQALALMNDPTFVEAARKLAERAILEAGPDPARRIRHAFRLVTARNPAPEELKSLRSLANEEMAAFRRDKAAVKSLLAVGESPVHPKVNPDELAAWTTVASTILNLDEAVTKE